MWGAGRVSSAPTASPMSWLAAASSAKARRFSPSPKPAVEPKRSFPELVFDIWRDLLMSSGDKARSGMYTFVAAIFCIGVLVAGAYVFIAKPGEILDKPVSEVVNPNG
jgi:hypothetical protein